MRHMIVSQVRPLLIALAVGVLLASGCGGESGVDRAELEARDAAEQADELEAQIEASDEEELRQELEDLREQLEAEEGGGTDDDGATNNGATDGAPTGGNTGGGNTGGNTGGGNTGGGNTGGATTPTGLSYCNANVAVNSVTSCPFAYNVVETIQIEGLVFDAWSPTTDQWYSMSCVDFGDAVECTGGNNARVVYIP